MMPQLPLRRRERPKAGDVALPEYMPEMAKEWAVGEEANVRERYELVGEVSAAMESRGYDTAALEAVRSG